jgi:putative ABC transport system substrate-binding protein
MRRREFITLLSGAAAAWPLAARAQQRERVRRVSVLMPFTADDPEGQARVLAFAQGLQQMGWTVGSNLRLDTRWGANDAERNRKYAAELLALAPDVILANGPPAVEAFLQATHDLPIVFANVPDPVGNGFVASLPRPGGNVTGFTPFEFGQSAKWLELLKEIAPRVTRAAVDPLFHRVGRRMIGQSPARPLSTKRPEAPANAARRKRCTSSACSCGRRSQPRPHRF